MDRSKPSRTRSKWQSKPVPARGPATRGTARAPDRGAKRPPGGAPRRASAPPADPARTLARQPWDSLRAFLPGDAPEQDRMLARLRAFALELLQWNRGVSNLISHADEPRLVERHFAESLAGVPLLSSLACEHIVDLGSGGGFPALPLALAGIGARWTLVESRRNKTLFLRRVVERLELRDIAVVTGRLEMLDGAELEALQCDGFTSRATMKAEPTLELALRIVQRGGHAALWKGSGLESELGARGAHWERDWLQPATHAIGHGPNSISIFKRRS